MARDQLADGKIGAARRACGDEEGKTLRLGLRLAEAEDRNEQAKCQRSRCTDRRERCYAWSHFATIPPQHCVRIRTRAGAVDTAAFASLCTHILKGLLTRSDTHSSRIHRSEKPMSRLLPRIAAVLLSGASLAACSTFEATNDKTAAEAAANAQAQTADDAVPATVNGLPTDLDGEIRRAQLLRSQGNFAEADKALGQLMLVAPDDPRIVGEYGKTLAQQGRSRDAVAFLSRATELSPTDWSVFSALGVAFDQSGDSADAKIAYQHALALKPGDAVVLNNFALSRMMAGDLPEARALIAQAQAADGQDPKIAQNVALIGSYGGKAAPAPANEAVASVAPLPPVAAPAGAAAAPRPLAGVVMQQVPVDPLAGPVSRPAHAVKHLAARTAKAKAVADKKDKAPALRMSADASIAPAHFRSAPIKNVACACGRIRALSARCA